MDLTEARDTVERYRGCGSPVMPAATWAVKEVERLTRENAKLREANYYWDDRDFDSAVPPDEVGAFDDVGDIIVLRPIHDLPEVFVLVTEDGPKFFPSMEEAEATKGPAHD